MELIIDLIVQYGWQAVTIAVVTFALVECFKPLARKFIKKETVRHVLYILLSYAFALGLTTALAAILHRIDELFQLYGPAMVVINVLCPIISNAGFFTWIEGVFSKLWEKTTENGAWKKVIKEVGSAFGVDDAILDTIATKVEEQYLSLIEANAAVFFTENKGELILNLKQKLAGFVDNGQLQTLAETLFKKLAESWKVNTDTE